MDNKDEWTAQVNAPDLYVNIYNFNKWKYVGRSIVAILERSNIYKEGEFPISEWYETQKALDKELSDGSM